MSERFSDDEFDGDAFQFTQLSGTPFWPPCYDEPVRQLSTADEVRSEFELHEEYLAVCETESEVALRRKLFAELVEELPPHGPQSIELRIKAQSRRSGLQGIDFDLDAGEWLLWCRCFGGKCAYCQLPVPFPVIEHVWPLSLGGELSLYNVVPACKSCNALKRDRDPSEFLRGHGEAFGHRVMRASFKFESLGRQRM